MILKKKMDHRGSSAPPRGIIHVYYHNIQASQKPLGQPKPNVIKYIKLKFEACIGRRYQCVHENPAHITKMASMPINVKNPSYFCPVTVLVDTKVSYRCPWASCCKCTSYTQVLTNLYIKTKYIHVLIKSTCILSGAITLQTVLKMIEMLENGFSSKRDIFSH